MPQQRQPHLPTTDTRTGLTVCPFPVLVVASQVLVLAAIHSAAADEPSNIQFARDVRPILSNHCFQCHGPDEAQRQADLRLDVEAGAKQRIDGHAAIVPGDLAGSELWRRVHAEGDERMPPAELGRPLSAAQIDILKRWIEQGAEWEHHWAFQAPVAVPPPVPRDRSWLRSPLDAYVAAELDRRDLAPQPQSDRERLLRRVTLDLTGLPPAPDEVASFLADDSPNAYERVVDRLLASPRYGERMAWVWLEAARYADTSGYQNDGARSMWRWRDWVIDALNRNLPFDQFTIEQLAGDLLPEATRDQIIATGFNRNHRGNSEGGIIPEEYQVEYVVDRVDTTSTVWLGLTMGCARCHDHKYDPITQREFYQVYAYFNNIPEFGRAIKEGNSPPIIVAPTERQERELARLDEALAAAEQRWQDLQPSLEEAQRAWEQTDPATLPAVWCIQRGRVAALDFNSPPGETRGSALASDLNVKFIDGDAESEPGISGRALRLDGHAYADAGDAGNFGYFDKFSAAAWVRPQQVASGTILSRMTDDERADGWYVQLNHGHLQVNLVKRWLDDAIRVETRPAIPAGEWTHVLVTYDGSRRAQGIQVYLNGQKVELKVDLDFLNQSFATKEPLRIGGGGGPAGRFIGGIDEVRIFERVLGHDEAAMLATAESLADILRLPRDRRTLGQQEKLATYYLAEVAEPEFRQRHDEYVSLRERRAAFAAGLPTVMVMHEMPQPRMTHILRRGEYDKPGDPVEPGVPQCLPSRPTAQRQHRLDFARWLVNGENPLTARVAVNRFWQLHFGAGLVRTPEDFGFQGEPPTHPQLLDWLAVEFMERGWDVKQLHRTIVTSATYRQSSAASSEVLAQDPDNRWLARGPRFRLSAEMIRDQVLAASGLLVEQLGGPSVKPYQPADLWKDLATDNTYVQDQGAGLYRRSLYTYWKRTVSPPSMTVFDAAGREACQVRTPRTNTPMQALTLMNEVTYVEAARMLAERVLCSDEKSAGGRIDLAFLLCAGRRPTHAESTILTDSLAFHLNEFREHSDRAAQLLEQGEHPRDARLDVAEHAAYTAICSLIMNLDEVISCP